MINATLEQYLEELKTLVNIDSFSRYPEGTARVADRLTELFKGIGWHVERKNISEEVGPLLIITNKTNAEHYDVMLSGHMDTVFPYGTVAERPFSMDENYAYGPGVADMKCGLVAGYYAVKSLQENNELGDMSIAFVFNPDEEISSRFSRPYIEEVAKKSDYCIVLESARISGNFVNERKGVGKFVVEFFGKSAHAAVNPHEGANALKAFILTSLDIMEWADEEKGTMVNIGIVNGGTTSNSIPDYTKTEIDIRISSFEEGNRIEKLFEALPNNLHVEGVTAKVSGKFYRPPMPKTEKTIAFCNGVDKICKKLGIKAEWESTSGGSDGNFAAALGVPTIDGFGPAGGHGHSVDELLHKKIIMERLELLYETIKYCGSNKY